MSERHDDDVEASAVGPRRAGRDDGTTFVELLVAIVLLGTAGIAVLTATTAAIVGARRSDEIAKVQQQLIEAADYLSDTDPENVPFAACDPTLSDSAQPAGPAYQDALDAQFGEDVVEVVAVQFWSRTTEMFGSCSANLGHRLQEVSLRVVINDATRTLAVVKRPTEIPTLDVGVAPPAPPYAGPGGTSNVALTPWINGGP